MASRRRSASASASVLALLLFSLSFAFLAALVAARVPHSHGRHVHAAYGNRHALHSRSAKLKLHDGESEFELLRVDEGIQFQIIVRVGGEKQYLYSDDEKVKTTADPEDVGVRRTVWVVVQGYAPNIKPYIGAISIQNLETGARLYYDDELQTFFGGWVGKNGSPISGWRLWASTTDRELRSGEFKLQSVLADGIFVDFPGNDHPQIFTLHFLPSEEDPDLVANQ